MRDWHSSVRGASVRSKQFLKYFNNLYRCLALGIGFCGYFYLEKGVGSTPHVRADRYAYLMGGCGCGDAAAAAAAAAAVRLRLLSVAATAAAMRLQLQRCGCGCSGAAAAARGAGCSGAAADVTDAYSIGRQIVVST